MCIELRTGHVTAPTVELNECQTFPGLQSTGPFSCNIPAGQIGSSTINYELIAYDGASGCAGNPVPLSPDNDGFDYVPTAIELASFGVAESFLLNPILLLAGLVGLAILFLALWRSRAS